MKQAKLYFQDVVHASIIGIACTVSYWIESQVLTSLTSGYSALLGGMWAAIATVFVFRATREETRSAALARLIATSVSVAVCSVYLWFFPFTLAGMATLIAIGTLAMMLLDRRDGIVTAGITTVVILVVAALSPVEAEYQPILRLLDTIVGIGVGVVSKWVKSLLY